MALFGEKNSQVHLGTYAVALVKNLILKLIVAPQVLKTSNDVSLSQINNTILIFLTIENEESIAKTSRMM